jgi:predicted ester cyclase
VTRLTASGTHERDLPGIPATGKRVTISGMYMTRYKDGRAAEAWVKLDFLGLYRQLGVVPTRGEAPAGTKR